MRLKKLDIVGFKSFAERTHIHLVDGVTAIVGPNGCGKTNILDALRWVMGEQRPTLLRGGKMEDVIFNGSQTLKSQGMAEVTLTIENNHGVLPSEYDELQITRRLFRSGESEYVLNKTTCRLRDITDLFADTGMGANAYSVIQQHMIDALISDKTEDRRILFEEAAGITKYKQRKRAAMRKLETTENDLKRLSDIVTEVKTQVNSLNRQMRKAERYQNTHVELKHLELGLAKITLDAASQEDSEKSQALYSARDQVSESDTKLASSNAELEEQRFAQSELDSKLSIVTGEMQAKTEEGHALDVRISGLKERSLTLSETRERNIVEMRACDVRLEQLLSDEAKLKEELQGREEALGTQLAEIASSEQISQDADTELLTARRNTQDSTEKLMALEGRISSGKSDTQNLSEQENESKERIEECLRQLSTLTNQIASTRAEKDKSSAQAKQAENNIADLTNRINETNQRIEEINADIEVDTENITDLSAALEATGARLRLLEEMMARHEGFGVGVAAALDSRERWPELLGPVADLIVPREGYIRAIEAALDDVAGYLVTSERGAAEKVINFLSSEQKGSAAVFTLDGFTAEKAPETNSSDNAESDTSQRRPLEEAGFVGWADRLVNPHPEAHALAQSLLCDTAVFDDSIDTLATSELRSLLERLPESTQVVTTSGKLYRGTTVLAGGSAEQAPRFGRKERAEELQENILRLESDLNTAREKKSEHIAEIARLRANISQLDIELGTEREEKNTAERKLSELTVTIAGQERDQQRYTQEQNSATDKLELLKHRQYTLTLDVDQLSGEKSRLLALVEERSQALTALEEKSQSAADSLNKLHVRLVEDKSAVNQITDRITHQQELRSEITQTKDSKFAENETAQREIELSAETTNELEERLKLVFDQRTELSRSEADVRQQRDAIVSLLREREEGLKEIRNVRERALKESHQLELRRSQIELETKALSERIFEEYSIDISEYQPETTEGEDSPQQFESEEDRSTARETVSALKQKMKSFGAVNLLAIEEFTSAQERYTYLSAQYEDLTKARATLQSTINKINKTAKEKFLETFSQARKHFKDVFTELFQGGECDLKLIDPTDPLESAIEIIAKPKGKKLVTITQMSGGERALTAISLLFALYLVKPSPFCILDEIDAPLDDANCHRFLRMIRRFANRTQFIIITHNKITMEAADTLYGVTMESPGISKLVSVRFGDVADDGRITLRNETIEDEDYEPEPIIQKPVSQKPIAPKPIANSKDTSGTNEALSEETVEDIETSEAEELEDTEVPAVIIERMQSTTVSASTDDTDAAPEAPTDETSLVEATSELQTETNRFNSNFTDDQTDTSSDND